VKTVIHWCRRDLRISDNTALSEAAKRAENVIPVFIFEDAFRTGPDVGAARLAFLLESVESLRKNLAELGYGLVIRCGKSEEVLPKLCRETGAEVVFANKRYEPYAQRRDERITGALHAAGFGFELFKDAVVWEEEEILTQAAKPYTVFTPYSKAWKARPIPPPRLKIRNSKLETRKFESDPLPSPDDLGHPLKQTIPPGGERAALELLRKFMAGPVYEYGGNRNFPAVEGTSNLSPHLRAGTIGIRTILAALKKAREKATSSQTPGCDVFLGELIWREFYLQVLHNFPHVTKGAFLPDYDQ
jgi:deoxyribodipyrimidine photo-lyase